MKIKFEVWCRTTDVNEIIKSVNKVRDYGGYVYKGRQEAIRVNKTTTRDCAVLSCYTDVSKRDLYSKLIMDTDLLIFEIFDED